MNIINVTASTWMSSAEALALLGVRPQTLYANVSRRSIRTKPDPDDPRRSLYHAGDVRRLAVRGRGRPSKERRAAESVSWGSPVLASGISTVVHGRLWYRGKDAVQLADRESLEGVAGLLWQAPPIPVSRMAGRESRQSAVSGALQAAYGLLALRAGRDPAMYGRSRLLLQREAAGLFADLSDAMIGAIESTTTERQTRRSARDVHERLARAWGRPQATDLIRRALVLLADHELNASTFATRVCASTGASLSASILAGFATLSGPRHGTAAFALQGLIDTAKCEGAENAIKASLDGGHPILAFGHPLYSGGDIRAGALLANLNPPPVFEDLRIHAERLLGELPNVDFALAALAASAGLPRDAPFVLFALARSVGWIAHALEQNQDPGLLRPRAHYVGPPLPVP